MKVNFHKTHLAFVCFSNNNWEKRRARKQQFMLHLSLREDVDKVLYIEPPLNLFRLIFLPFSELKTKENRSRWLRALKFKTEQSIESKKLFIFTPIFFIPFAFRVQFIYNLNRYISLLIIKTKLRQLNFANIVLWLYHPFDYPLLKWFKDRVISVFDWAEDWAEYFTEYSHRRRQYVKATEKKIIADADLVFVVTKKLLQIAKDINKDSFQILDGTIPEIFLNAGKFIPHDLKEIEKPIIGYAGTIHVRMDRSLVLELSDRIPECSFVFVGDVLLKSSEMSALRNRKNVYFLGGKKYSELPDYLINFDVCILPYLPDKDSAPTKIYDYLAAGKPVVSTYLPELLDLKDILKLARTREDFITFVKDSLGDKDPDMKKMRIEKARENSWFARTDEIMRFIRDNINI